MPKKTSAKKRLTDTTTVQEAGCHDCDKKWATGNANQMAALHHDKTGHKTWCKIAMNIVYGTEAPPVTSASNDAADVRSAGNEVVANSEKSDDPSSTMVNFRCGKCGVELGVHDRSLKLQCRKCGGAGVAYVEAAPSEWREPMAEGDLVRDAPKPVEPEQSIEEFLLVSRQEAAGPPKSIEELIEDRVNQKSVAAGPKFEF